MEDNSFNKITKLVDQYQNWYWTSDFDDINLIEDLRLSSNIHETAHSQILFKLLKSGKRYGFPLWQEFSKMLDWDTNNASVFGPPEKYNIDLLVEGFDSKNQKFAVIIENKINDAIDQDEQIQRYIQSLITKESFKEEQIYVIYLTRNDNAKEPSEDSFPSAMKERFVNRYHRISYEKEIRQWINNCQKIWVNELIRSVLVQYGNYLTGLFESNKEKERVMIYNIETWCFGGESYSKSLSEIDSLLKEKKDAMSELQNQMDLFYRDSVVHKMEKVGFEVECYKSVIHYLCFKIEYVYNDIKLDLKGHLNFRKDYDGNKIWFGIETDSIHKAIKLFKSESMIEGSDAETIIAKFKDKLSGYKNDGSPYLCWKYSTLDTVIDDIRDYRAYIEEISDNKKA
jgi:hypothetical protein